MEKLEISYLKKLKQSLQSIEILAKLNDYFKPI